MNQRTLYRTILVALPVLHFLLHVGFGLDRAAPDLLTVGILLLAREVRMGPAAAIGFGLGLLEDAFSIRAFGANALSCTILGIFGSRSRDLFVGETFVFLVSYLFLGTWVRGLLHWLIIGPELRPDGLVTLLVHGPVDAGYAALVGIGLLLATGAWRSEPSA